jgi:uncharacterized protein (DUF433 family)
VRTERRWQEREEGLIVVLQDREQQLIERWIEQDPALPAPHEARLKEHGVPVWVLVGYWQGSAQDADTVAGAYGAPQEAIAAALAYYHQHQALIDARIALNAAVFTV